MPFDKLAFITQSMASTPDGTGEEYNVTIDTQEVNIQTEEN